jgi:acetoin utilization deacetylase AcuC-like enzyme
MQQPLFVSFDPIYAHPLPEGHRFPMLKYELIPEQLMYEGVITAANLHAPGYLPKEWALYTHCNEYLDHLLHQTLDARSMRKIGFPLSAELVDREMRLCQGTIDCAEHVLQHGGIALNVAGGTHHAFYNRGEGFCLLNDFAVTVNYLLQKQKIKKALIVDLDVHQGNGTAALFESNDRVFTFSMHGEHNYPFHKEKSDLDIPLAEGMDDNTYLQLLQQHLPQLLDSEKPDLVCYLSGVDVLQTDKFGKLGLTHEGCRHRDEIVLAHCTQREIPVAVAMGGGYSPDVNDIVKAHCNTFKVAGEMMS